MRQLETILYGDSSLFIFQKDATLKHIYPYESVNLFKNAPYLISLKENASQKHFIHKTFDIKPSDIIIAATDGFANFLLSQYILFIKNNPDLPIFNQILLEKNMDYVSRTDNKPLLMYDIDFKQLLNTIKNKLSNDANAFELFVSELYHQQFLPNDDCSVIFIEFHEKSLLNANDPTTEDKNIDFSEKQEEQISLSIFYNNKWVKEFLDNILSAFPNIIKDQSIVDIISNYFVISK